MKKKNIILLGIGLVSVILVIMLVCIYLFKNRVTYELNIPNYEDVEKIVFKKNEVVDTLNSNNYIEIIIDILNNKKRVTYDESIQDYPVNVDDVIKVDFYLKSNGTITFYMYEKNNKYYIEQPYNGIYKLKEDEFDNINYFIFQENLSNDVINKLEETKTIVVNSYTNDKLIKNIKDEEKINSLITLMGDTKIWNGSYNDIGLEYNLYFLDKENNHLAEASILPDFQLAVDEEHYFLINIDMDLVRKLIEE